jgi:hypothetical protein
MSNDGDGSDDRTLAYSEGEHEVVDPLQVVIRQQSDMQAAMMQLTMLLLEAVTRWMTTAPSQPASPTTPFTVAYTDHAPTSGIPHRRPTRRRPCRYCQCACGRHRHSHLKQHHPHDRWRSTQTFTAIRASKGNAFINRSMPHLPLWPSLWPQARATRHRSTTSRGA